MNDRTIPLTGSRAELLVPEDDAFEPRRGSVVLVDGIYGTAFQRLFSDGLWHSAAGSLHGRSWLWLLGQRNLVVVYDADIRPEAAPTPRPTGKRASVPIGA